MKKHSKKRRKELRDLYEKIQSDKYIREMEKEPLCGSFKWVGCIIRN